MGQRIGGMDFDITLGTDLINVKSITMDVTDNTAVAKTRGVPDGHVNGDAEAGGEMELDTKNFKKITAVARAAGGYRSMPLTDILWYANTGDEELKVEAFGCKLIVTTPLAFDPNGAETATHKVKFLVTSPDFVKIDGVPILSAQDVRDLIG
jgi:hypothetical protein